MGVVFLWCWAVAVLAATIMQASCHGRVMAIWIRLSIWSCTVVGRKWAFIFLVFLRWSFSLQNNVELGINFHAWTIVRFLHNQLDRINSSMIKILYIKGWVSVAWFFRWWTTKELYLKTSYHKHHFSLVTLG